MDFYRVVFEIYEEIYLIYAMKFKRKNVDGFYVNFS